MMKSRTVTQRNLAGGFLGGMLGILIGGYVHAMLVPVGCLLGVVVGWWYEAISNAIAVSAVAGTARVKHLWHATVFMPLPTLKDIRIRSRVLRSVREVIATMGGYCNRAIAPLVRLYRWFQKRRTRQFLLMRGIAASGYIVLMTICILPLWIAVFRWISPIVKGEIRLLPLIVSTMGTAGWTIVITSVLAIAFQSGWRRAYRSYCSFCTHSMGWSLLREGVMLVYTEVVVILIVSLFFLFAVLFIIPVSIAVGLMKGIALAATSAENWLCFAVTLAVTMMVAWVVHPSLASPSILWVTALTTGLLSGIAAEGTRRLILLVLRHSRVNQMIQVPLTHRLNPGCFLFERWLGQIVRALGFSF